MKKESGGRMRIMLMENERQILLAVLNRCDRRIDNHNRTLVGIAFGSFSILMLLRDASYGGLDINEGILIAAYLWFGILGLHSMCRIAYYSRMAEFAMKRAEMSDTWYAIQDEAKKDLKKGPLRWDLCLRELIDRKIRGFWKVVTTVTVILMLFALYAVLMLPP